MASSIARILCALSILQYALPVNEQGDLSTEALQRQREAEQAELQQQLMWRLQQLELKRQQPREPREAEPLSLWQHYGWWAAADTLLLLLGLLRLCRKRRAAPASGSQPAVSGAKEEEGPARHTPRPAALRLPRRLRGGRGRRGTFFKRFRRTTSRQGCTQP